MRKVKEVQIAEDTISFEWDKKKVFGLKYTAHYGFIRSLCDKNLIDSLKDFSLEKRKLKNFVQVGIGGSALPASAALTFLEGSYFNFEDDRRYFALDNLDPERLKFVFSMDLNKTFFHVVSKSGKTSETLLQFFILLERGNINPENVAISTSKNSFLDELGEKLGVKRFYIPDEVVGRYSVFTTVGLLALKFFDCDIKAFIEGAKNGVRAYRNGFSFPNEFVDFAMGNYNSVKNILVIFPYKDRLLKIGEWFRQLWAESLGKGGKGQTPVLALGVTDQHSQLQLYQDGPLDKAFVFIDMPECCDFEASDDYGFGLFKGVSAAKLMKIEKEATKKALKSKGCPVSEIYIKKPDEFALGNLFISLMIATAKAGEVLGIDPFNQPGVELSKKFAREALKDA